MYGYIYKTTNLTNNKIYIGQHKSSLFTSHYMGSGRLIKEAIDKYGKSNFKVELICWCKTSEQADLKEKEYIKLNNYQNLDIGYNLSKGGKENTFSGLKHTDQTKLQMRNKKLGIKLSSDHCKHISESKKGQKYPEESNKRRAETLHNKYLKEGRVSPHKGSKMSEEAKEKIRQWHLGRQLSEQTKQKMSEVKIGIKHKPHKKHNYPKHRKSKIKHI